MKVVNRLGRSGAKSAGNAAGLTCKNPSPTGAMLLLAGGVWPLSAPALSPTSGWNDADRIPVTFEHVCYRLPPGAISERTMHNNNGFDARARQAGQRERRARYESQY